MGGAHRNFVVLAVALIVLVVPLGMWSAATRAHINPWPWVIGVPVTLLGLLAVYEYAIRHARVVIGPLAIEVDWFLTHRRIQRADIARLVSTVRITPQGLRVPTLVLVGRNGEGLGNLIDRFDWSVLASALRLTIETPPIDGSLDDLEKQFPGALVSASTVRTAVAVTVVIVIAAIGMAVWVVTHH
jgi:hypothetical protein